MNIQIIHFILYIINDMRYNIIQCGTFILKTDPVHYVVLLSDFLSD